MIFDTTPTLMVILLNFGLKYWATVSATSGRARPTTLSPGWRTSSPGNITSFPRQMLPIRTPGLHNRSFIGSTETGLDGQSMTSWSSFRTVPIPLIRGKNGTGIDQPWVHRLVKRYPQRGVVDWLSSDHLAHAQMLLSGQSNIHLIISRHGHKGIGLPVPSSGEPGRTAAEDQDILQFLRQAQTSFSRGS